jgi:hypothetical protein
MIPLFATPTISTAAGLHQAVAGAMFVTDQFPP